MTILIKSTLVILVLSSISIYADSGYTHDKNNHEGHKHSHHFDKIKKGVSKEAVEKAAINEVQSLVANKKIHQSWQHVPISKIGKTHYGDTDDWVVGFDNIKIKNKKRQTLYIFVSVHGEIRGANYTGN